MATDQWIQPNKKPCVTPSFKNWAEVIFQHFFYSFDVSVLTSNCENFILVCRNSQFQVSTVSWRNHELDLGGEICGTDFGVGAPANRLKGGDPVSNDNCMVCEVIAA